VTGRLDSYRTIGIAWANRRPGAFSTSAETCYLGRGAGCSRAWSSRAEDPTKKDAVARGS